MAFELVGVINNKTSHNWNKVKLTLSTAQPNQNLILSGLRRWVVDFVQYNKPRVYGKKKRLYMGNTTNNMAEMDDKSLKDAKFDFNYSVEKSNTIQQSYSLPNRVTIKKYSKDNKVVLKTKKVKTNYKHVSIPKVAPDGYLQALIPDWGSLNLLKAQANVYNEGNFIGKTYINTASVLSNLKIYLGRDKKMVVKRIYRHVKTDVNLIGKTKEYYEYTITLRNNRRDTINLKLVDQIPMSANEEITVEILEDADGKYIKGDGTLRWNYKLKVNESKLLKVRFMIKHPKSKKVYFNQDYKNPMITY